MAQAGHGNRIAVVQRGWTIEKLVVGSDFRETVRALAAAPSFFIVTAVTLALGLGANMTMFSVLNEILFRPAPFVRNPAELVTNSTLFTIVGAVPPRADAGLNPARVAIDGSQPDRV